MPIRCVRACSRTLVRDNLYNSHIIMQHQQLDNSSVDESAASLSGHDGRISVASVASLLSVSSVSRDSQDVDSSEPCTRYGSVAVLTLRVDFCRTRVFPVSGVTRHVSHLL